MMKKLVALLLTIAALCVMASPAGAGERAGAFSLSPFIGGYTFDGVEHLKTSPVYGLRLGYDLTKNWGVEAVGDYLATEQTIGDKSFNALSYRLDLLFNIMPDGPLVPYLAIGGGGITAGHGSGFNLGGRNTFATANAGLGLKYFVTDSIALRGDARQFGWGRFNPNLRQHGRHQGRFVFAVAPSIEQHLIGLAGDRAVVVKADGLVGNLEHDVAVECFELSPMQTSSPVPPSDTTSLGSEVARQTHCGGGRKTRDYRLRFV